MHSRLSFSETPFGLATSIGLAKGTTAHHVFGLNPVATTTEETVWDNKGVYTFPPDAGAEMFISSSDNGDTHEVQVTGLDENFSIRVLEFTLVGQTKTSLGASLLWSRILSVKNVNSTVTAGNVYVYQDDTVVAGVPQTQAKIHAKMIAGNETTLMALYTVPAGKTAFILHFDGSSNRVQGVVFKLYQRAYGKVFRVEESASIAGGSAYHQDMTFPREFPAKTDLVIRSKLDSGTAVATASFEIVIIDTTELEAIRASESTT